jgi:hypothetical protein
VSLRNVPLFHPGSGLGTPFLFAQVRKKAPLRPLKATNVLVDGGAPSAYFGGWWRASFPTRQDLPSKVANKDGTGTEEFWSVFA